MRPERSKKEAKEISRRSEALDWLKETTEILKEVKEQEMKDKIEKRGFHLSVILAVVLSSLKLRL